MSPEAQNNNSGPRTFAGPEGGLGRLLRAPIPPGLIERLLLMPMILMGAARAYEYLVYVYYRLPSPTEIIFGEAKMALLAWRVQSGLPLYPAWWDYPHVANFFSPAYFWLVGLLGAASGADLSQLFLIGRAVSFVSGLLTSIVVGIYLGRRYSLGAGVVGAVLSLGAVPMHGFSVVVRPDMTAELLGIGGFLLLGHRSPRWHRIGCALLVLAILTKQTAGTYLLAGAAALVLEGRWRQAAATLGAVLAATALLIAVVTLVREPHLPTCLLGEAHTPRDDAGWSTTLDRLTTHDPDLLMMTALGLLLWNLGPVREPRMTALAVVVLGVGLVTSRKLGANVNYYLSLRVVEGLAAGTLWHIARFRRAWQLVPLGAVAYVGFFAFWDSLEHTRTDARYAASRQSEPPRGDPARTRIPIYGAITRLAREPSVHLLTDVGLFDLYQGERAAFGDPWVFRMLVKSGQVRPIRMERWIEEEYYDLIITLFDLSPPGYETFDFGLPMCLVERARAHYVRIGERDGLYFYARRRDPPGRWDRLLGTGPG